MIHQFVPRLEPGAVGAHVLELQKLCVEMTGQPSEIFVGTAHASLAARSRPYRDYGRRVRAGRGDVLIYQSAIGSPVGDFVARRRQRLVVNFHNLTPVRFLRGWDPDAAEGVLWGERQLRQLAVRTSLAVADSSFNADHLRAAGYPPRAIAVAPVLFSLVDLPVTLPPASAGANWLFVGRLSANKAQHRLVAALAAYRRLYDPDARLWLVGGEDQSRYGRAVTAFAASLGLASAVCLTGPVAPEVLAAHYRRASVFVCLSEHEGFCVPLVEAMHHGVAVVTQASTAIPETVQDAGVVLPFGASGRPPSPRAVAAAVHLVVTDAAVRSRLVSSGHQRAAQLSLATTRQRHRALLERVLES